MSYDYGDYDDPSAAASVAHRTPTTSFTSDQLKYFSPLFEDYGGAGGDIGIASAAGAPGSDIFGGVRAMANQSNPKMGGLVQSGMRPSGSANQQPGGAVFPMSVPNTPVGLAVGGAEGLPTPANQAAIVRPRTQPTGHEWPAGNPVKSNYSNLNRLRNRAYGVSYG